MCLLTLLAAAWWTPAVGRVLVVIMEGTCLVPGDDGTYSAAAIARRTSTHVHKLLLHVAFCSFHLLDGMRHLSCVCVSMPEVVLWAC